MPLSGKNILVTGAAGSIGAATVKLLLSQGACLLAVDRDAAALDGLSEEAGAGERLLAMQVDVTEELGVAAAVDRCRSRFGSIDFLFNNAGVEGLARSIADYPLDEFRRVMEINVTSVFLGLKYAMPVMKAARGGSILNMASVSGLGGTPRMPAYNASKHAVVGLTRSAALEGAPHGVRVNALCPGPVESPMMESLERTLSKGDPAAMHQRLAAAIPARRYARIEEVAAAVAFFASDHSQYASGVAFPLDGGFTAA